MEVVEEVKEGTRDNSPSRDASEETTGGTGLIHVAPDLDDSFTSDEEDEEMMKSVEQILKSKLGIADIHDV